MKNSRFAGRPCRSLALTLLLVAGSAGVLHAKPDQDPAKPKIQVLNAGTYKIEVTAALDWTDKPARESEAVFFDYLEQPARTASANVSVFRQVVPREARGGDRVKLAEAYIIYDVAGAAMASFKQKVKLVRVVGGATEVNGGQLLSYTEEIDTLGRERSSKFFRAWVFFPKTYAKDGALFLVLARDQSSYAELKPTHLDRVAEIISGIREP